MTDRNVTAAAQHFDAQEAAAESACARAAAAHGLTAEQAEQCDDGDQGCPTCPWRKPAAGVDVPRAAQPLPGLQTLQNVVECLRADARYVDEEGEATNRLQDLLDALRAAGMASGGEAQRIAELAAEVADVRRWYGDRLEILSAWARVSLKDEPLQTFFNIAANARPHHTDEPEWFRAVIAKLAAKQRNAGVKAADAHPAPFSTWAAGEGYDIAQTYDTERSRWVFLNPMTADLWKAWQAARGVAPCDGGKTNG